MVPVKKEDLRKMVTQKTLDIYEDLTPQLIQLIDQTKHDDSLSEAQKHEIIIEVLAEILGIQED